MEIIPTVNAGTVQYLKPPAEGVLVDGGRSLEPEVNIDKKFGGRIDRYWRVAEVSTDVLLPGQLSLSEAPFQNVPRRHFGRQPFVPQKLGGDRRKPFLVVIDGAPRSFDAVSQVLENFHRFY